MIDCIITGLFIFIPCFLYCLIIVFFSVFVGDIAESKMKNNLDLNATCEYTEYKNSQQKKLYRIAEQKKVDDLLIMDVAEMFQGVEKNCK